MWAYLGTIAVLWGAKLVGDKKLAGWLWFIFGDLLWIIEGIKIQQASGNPAVIVCELLFLILHIRGYMKWKSLRRQKWLKIN
jgi:hypothetical protein